MTVFKILLGLAALLVAWALLFRAQLVYRFNRWMREFAFSDQWVVFSGRRIALLFFVLGCIALFSGLENITENQPVKTRIVGKMLEQAQQEFSKGHYSHAINRCEVVLRSDPDNIQARELIATSYFFSGSNEKAYKEVAQILRLNPTYAMSESPFAKFLDRRFIKKK